MKFVKRIVIYLAGLFFVALGVAFSVNSNLGVSPVNSLPYVVSRILGKDLGTCVTVIFIGYILIQILLLRKGFPPLDLAQILCSFAFGYFVDLTETLSWKLLPSRLSRKACNACHQYFPRCFWHLPVSGHRPDRHAYGRPYRSHE